MIFERPLFTTHRFFSSGVLFHSLPDDSRFFSKRIKDLVAAYFNEFKNRLARPFNPYRNHTFPVALKDSEGKITYDRLYEADQTTSKALVAFIHGLGSSPLTWTHHLDAKVEGATVFIPHVYKKGYCKVSRAAEPIFDVITSYSRQFPDNPVILVGHSNGGRIAAYIEQRIQVKKVCLISIAGVHGGSKLVNLFAYFKINRFFGFTESMTRELMFSGTSVVDDVTKWQSLPVDLKQVERVFIATAEDTRAFPICTAFPNVPNSSYYLLSGESHVSIIDRTGPFIVQLIKKQLSTSH